jgi:hypothetical protein
VWALTGLVSASLLWAILPSFYRKYGGVGEVGGLRKLIPRLSHGQVVIRGTLSLPSWRVSKNVPGNA